ncbi:glycosyl hydrolase [Saccharibacillus sp. O16]|nr:glycosyl hydrolase [Saccharibacillus sp. O16]
MIEIKSKQIRIDGKPMLLMCGEIHYYRLAREDWEDRIIKLKQAGCNAVGSYVPWLCHEPVEGQVDLDGSTRAELDLGAFIDLCAEHGLYFFVRPGPFIMAEMKNEGIPYWIYEKHPHLIPVGWDERAATTPTLDYLAPDFLRETRIWYRRVMEIIKPRLLTNGGKIIAVQLDNEIGMLSWVSNSPDLTDGMLEDFADWLVGVYGEAGVQSRYPFASAASPEWRVHVRSPEESWSIALHRDLGYYMRGRFARYVRTLRDFAEENGVSGVPFVVNIHGTGAGRGFTFPIGISQLMETYNSEPGYVAGSDIYFGDLDMNSFQDLYLINAFMDAVQAEDQPLTSVEFNCGDGNFGETFSGRTDVSAADLKTRLCIAQGNRMLNYYLMAGGRNYRLDDVRGDGNDRIALTGERHGFAAPISPEGKLNYTFPRMAQGIQAMRVFEDKVAEMNEERDPVSFAFVPDYYMTEYRYPGSALMANLHRNLESARSHGAWEIVARAMLLAGYRFGATDIQNRPLNPESVPVLVLPCAKYLHAHVQAKLVEYMLEGGSLLLYGEVPMFDMEGRDCTLLADALGAAHLGELTEADYPFLSVVAEGWAAPRSEVRASRAQLLRLSRGEALFRPYGREEVCGFEAKVGSGCAVVLAMTYRCDIEWFRSILEHLGASAGLQHDFEDHGIWMTSTCSPKKGERFIHILNLDGYEKEFRIYDSGEVLFEGRSIVLGAREGLMLPIGVELPDGLGRILYSTAEVASIHGNKIVFRSTPNSATIKIKTNRKMVSDDKFDHIVEGSVQTLTFQEDVPHSLNRELVLMEG